MKLERVILRHWTLETLMKSKKWIRTWWTELGAPMKSMNSIRWHRWSRWTRWTRWSRWSFCRGPSTSRRSQFWVAVELKWGSIDKNFYDFYSRRSPSTKKNSLLQQLGVHRQAVEVEYWPSMKSIRVVPMKSMNSMNSNKWIKWCRWTRWTRWSELGGIDELDEVLLVPMNSMKWI